MVVVSHRRTLIQLFDLKHDNIGHKGMTMEKAQRAVKRFLRKKIKFRSAAITGIPEIVDVYPRFRKHRVEYHSETAKKRGV